MQTYRSSAPLLSCFWDLLCCASIVGIWPRFIEPELVLTTMQSIALPKLPSPLNGFKILQISDLHFNDRISERFLQKIIAKCQRLKPDLIAFTGDFLCHSHLSDYKKLRAWLNSFSAPYGCYASLGNHDYANYIGINSQGEYDALPPPSSLVSNGFKKLFQSTTLTKTRTERTLNVHFHGELHQLLAETPFKLLHNETVTIPVKNTRLNISGLGEYMLGRCEPSTAFSHYDEQYPGIALVHNPDGIPMLNNYPGDLILCGHTHGGQLNLPLLWKKFTLMENMQFKQGLFRCGNKWAYVNRGLGSVLPLRLFSPPEILLLTLERSL